MELVEDIGPILGFVAFIGFAALVPLLISQSQEVRRLREWAGRAPERAIVEAEREAEERGVPERSRLAGVKAWLARTYESIDGVSPVDPRFGLVFLLAVVLGAGALTSGFGILGDDGDGTAAEEADTGIDRKRFKVAVLNGTATEASPAVPGLAAKVARRVRRDGYKLGEVTNTDSLAKSIVVFRRGNSDAAEQLAEDMRGALGPTKRERMTDAIVGQSRGADLAILVGLDDARL